MRTRIKPSMILPAILLFSTLAPGQTSRPQQPPTGEATLTIKEQFANSFLDGIFNNLQPPSMPLIISESDRNRTDESAKTCPSVLTLEREHGGVRTNVKFEQNRITAPLAFSGSYNSTLLGCLQFRGLAYTEWNLEFDRNAQVLSARIKVTDMRLEGLPALTQGTMVKVVQTAIDSRINPVKLLRPEQLSSVVPVAPAGGSLRLRAREVQPEILPGLLHLHISYEFLPEKSSCNDSSLSVFLSAATSSICSCNRFEI